MPDTGYKDPKEGLAKRRKILRWLCRELPWLEVPSGYAETADHLDALIASLTVRAAAQGQTDRPSPEQLPFARVEGWIHLPEGLPTL